MKTLILDTETTGTDDPEVVEVGWLQVDEPIFCLSADKFNGRFRPGKPITLGALATHHIMDEDLKDCPPSCDFVLPADTAYLVGHNIDFDWKAIGSPDVKRICTLALCRMVYPQVDSHTLSAMFHHLERETARERLKGAHSAFEDVLLCRDILRHIVKHLNLSTWEELWIASEEARVPKIMPFGKHKGVPIEDVPFDYKMWLLRQPDVDPYLRKAFMRD